MKLFGFKRLLFQLGEPSLKSYKEPNTIYGSQINEKGYN
ncbi:unnamed protein product [Musa acuminata subsp. burmannicoides]